LGWWRTEQSEPAALCIKEEHMESPDNLLALEPLTILDAPDAADIQLLEDRIYEFNAARTGIDDGRLLAILVRDGHEEIIAGLYGWTWGRCCEVRTLWVHELWRGKGLGTRLMAAAEAEARARGAAQMVTSTHSFQAPGFYRRLGFESVGQIDDYPLGYSHIFLRKQL
jgi:GNAT superfamily N-acetyltransferase